MFQVIMKTDYCPGGSMATKTKQADGSWRQTQTFSNGSPMIYRTHEKASKEAALIMGHSSARTQAAWIGVVSDELAAWVKEMQIVLVE